MQTLSVLKVKVAAPFTSIDFFSDVITSVIRMSEAGMPFSYSALTTLQDDRNLRVARCVAAAKTRFNLPLAGKGAMKELHALFGEAIATLDIVPDDPRTAGSNPVIDHHAFQFTKKNHDISLKRLNKLLLLHHLAPHSPHARALRLSLKHQEARDTVSRFTGKLLRMGIRKGDSLIIYPSWHITPSPYKDGGGAEGGTMQSRITASNPPIQTLPAIVKACMHSRFPGGTLLSMDLSQIELRTAALLSGDVGLLRAYQEGRDLHADLAASVMGEQVRDNPYFGTGDNKRDPRQIYKVANFLALYRGGAGRLQQQILEDGGPLLPLDQCRDIIYRMKLERQGLWMWQDEIIARARKDGLLTLPWTGQTRHFDPKNEREPISFVNQATASNVTLRLMNCWRRLPKRVILCVNVYDSITLDCPAGTLEDTKGVLEETMHWLRTEDYWAALEARYDRKVPLTYSFTEKH